MFRIHTPKITVRLFGNMFIYTSQCVSSQRLQSITIKIVIQIVHTLKIEKVITLSSHTASSRVIVYVHSVQTFHTNHIL
jgi:hypothetical protein